VTSLFVDFSGTGEMGSPAQLVSTALSRVQGSESFALGVASAF
jgi:hypothetical protein